MYVYVFLYEAMLPLFFNHQAVSDDFFVDLAETKGFVLLLNIFLGWNLCFCGAVWKG